MRPDQIDVSIKNLLKQVYTAHTTRTKSLEDEIEELKNKLFEATRKLDEKESDCKRCAELEEAFTACKTALQEQTKWFENFGQKFSIFNNSDSKTLSTKTSKLQDDIAQVHCEISSDVKCPNPISEKPTISKQTFLQNLMSLNPSDLQDSLNLYTVPFPDNFGQDCSSLNPDSMILAPDTVDVTEIPINKSHKIKHEVLKPSEQLTDVVEVKIKDNLDTNRLSKKRACAESSSSHKSPKKKTSKSSENDSSDEKRIKERGIGHKKSELTAKEDKSSPKQSTDHTAETFISEVNSKTAILHTNNIKKKVALDVEIGKDVNEGFSGEIPSITTEKNCQTKQQVTVSKDSLYQVSPSLIPLKKNDKVLFQNQLMVTEDINDFESPGVNKKQQESEQAWSSCDKRKLKKGPSIKTIKAISKFKMTLDSLPPNYKKPTYRQTKLSKSIFHPKSSSGDDTPSTSSKKILSDCNNDTSSMSKKSSPIKTNSKTCTVDFDATCIPDNYEVSSSEKSVQQEASDEDLEEILLIQDDSSDEISGHSSNESLMSKVKVKHNEVSKENSGKAAFEDFLSHKKQVVNENVSSFDRLPKKEEPNYKYKEATVRKKSERKQLNAFDCRECEKYYADLGLSEEEKQKRMKKCSRHRSKFAPPATPEHFWELDFPDTQECKARGYLNETQKGTLRTHRRRPL